MEKKIGTINRSIGREKSCSQNGIIDLLLLLHPNSEYLTRKQNTYNLCTILFIYTHYTQFNLCHIKN